MADKTAQTIYIDADPSTVMDVIADIGSYPDWVAEYQETEVLEADDAGYPKVARLVLDLMMSVGHRTGLFDTLATLPPSTWPSIDHRPMCTSTGSTRGRAACGR